VKTPAKPLVLHASYLTDIIRDPRQVIQLAEKALFEVDFDTVVGIGLSGALIVPQMAAAFGKNFAIVRKVDNTHSDQPVEGHIGARWLFVDDLICTGSTYKHVVNKMKLTAELYSHDTQHVGAYLYFSRRFFAPADVLLGIRL
jgi:orotate phosphoribosyltransferase-like protein